MRILHVSQPTTAGTAVVVRELVRVAIGRGDDVQVACPDDGDLHGWVQELGATWIPLDLRRSPGPSDLRAVRRLRRLMSDVDVVHLHSSKAGAVGRLAGVANRRRPPIVFTPHGWSWLVGGRLAAAYRLFERWAYRRCEAVAVVSDREYALGVAVLGAAGHLRTITNGVDTDRFTPVAEADPDGPLTVVTVGRLTRQKGIDRVLSAVAGVDRTDVSLTIVGEGPDLAELQAYAEELGIAGQTTFAGAITDPAPYYRSASVVVLPSRWEGLSLVALEAMACGACVLTTDAIGSALLAEAAVVVPAAPEDPSVLALTKALDDLLDEPERRLDLGVRARALCVEQFSLERMTDQYVQLWESVSRSVG